MTMIDDDDDAYLLNCDVESQDCSIEKNGQSSNQS